MAVIGSLFGAIVCSSIVSVFIIIDYFFLQHQLPKHQSNTNLGGGALASSPFI